MKLDRRDNLVAFATLIVGLATLASVAALTVRPAPEPAEDATPTVL
jgi:hypothetical protein